MKWFYADQGQQKGPVEESALNDLVLAGVVRDDTLVWNEDMPTWQAHASVRGAAPSSAPLSTTATDTRYCGECGRPFPANELVAIGPVAVCAMCKPAYLQKLREGGAAVSASAGPSMSTNDRSAASLSASTANRSAGQFLRGAPLPGWIARKRGPSRSSQGRACAISAPDAAKIGGVIEGLAPNLATAWANQSAACGPEGGGDGR